MPNHRQNAMRRIVTFIGIFGMAGAIVAAGSSRTFAQFGGGFGNSTFQPPNGFGLPASQQLNNPPVSPSLLLTQPGINPAVAAQTLIQPQQQLGNAVLANQQQLGNLQNGLNQLSQPQGALSATPLLQTGHPTMFLNTLDYFPALSQRRH
ncbi:MAG TPA: hypothetical protein VGP76_29170 [Planctomycetaceae bacterium]|nr:hypothetical protein [Planctomycetaceae bacterium]